MKTKFGTVTLIIALLLCISDKVSSQSLNGKIGWQNLNKFNISGSVDLSNWEGGIGYGYYPGRIGYLRFHNIFTSLSYNFQNLNSDKLNLFFRSQFTFRIKKNNFRYDSLRFANGSIPTTTTTTTTINIGAVNNGNTKEKAILNYYAGLSLGAKYKINDRIGMELELGSMSNILVINALNFQLTDLFTFNAGLNLIYVLVK